MQTLRETTTVDVIPRQLKHERQTDQPSTE